MDTNLMQSIQAEIEKALPAIHAGVLKDFIANAQRQAEELLKYKDENVRLRAVVERLSRFEVLEAKLNAQEANQIETARKLAHTQELMDVKLQCEKDKTTVVLSMFGQVFRNSEIRQSKLGSMPCLVESQYQNGDKFSHVEQRETSITETTEKL